MQSHPREGDVASGGRSGEEGGVRSGECGSWRIVGDTRRRGGHREATKRTKSCKLQYCFTT